MACKNARDTLFSSTCLAMNSERSTMAPYSRSAPAGVMFTAHSRSRMRASSVPTGGTPNSVESRSLDLVCASSTRLPLCADAMAIAAATVVRPTPPLPAMMTSCLSKRLMP